MKTLAALKQLRLGSTDSLIASARKVIGLSASIWCNQPQSQLSIAMHTPSNRPAFTRTNRGYEDCLSLGEGSA